MEQRPLDSSTLELCISSSGVAREMEQRPLDSSTLSLSLSRDVSHCDGQGRSALHLVASSHSVHAKKMVSLLVQKGSSVGE